MQQTKTRFKVFTHKVFVVAAASSLVFLLADDAAGFFVDI